MSQTRLTPAEARLYWALKTALAAYDVDMYHTRVAAIARYMARHLQAEGDDDGF